MEIGIPKTLSFRNYSIAVPTILILIKDINTRVIAPQISGICEILLAYDKNIKKYYIIFLLRYIYIYIKLKIFV